MARFSYRKRKGRFNPGTARPLISGTLEASDWSGYVKMEKGKSCKGGCVPIQCPFTFQNLEKFYLEVRLGGMDDYSD